MVVSHLYTSIKHNLEKTRTYALNIIPSMAEKKENERQFEMSYDKMYHVSALVSYKSLIYSHARSFPKEVY